MTRPANSTPIKNKLQRALESKYSLWVLGGLSFAESALVPIPIDAFSIPIMLAQHQKIWLISLLLSITSVLGGIVGYSIGYLAFDTIGITLIQLYGLEASYTNFQNRFAETGAFIILIGAITPIPFKVICIATGAAMFGFPEFILLAGLGRGIRFFAVALLIYLARDRVWDFIQTKPRLASILATILLIFGFIVIPYL